MENYSRISNICYPRGSVVYATFDKNSEYYFLNMRPLIVVSNQTQMFDSLSCIACGSRDRPGIEISLMNHMYGRWIGGHQFSVAQPYALYTVLVSQIAEFHGVIDPYTMKAIDKAMAFHLGLTEEVPPYMEGIYKDLLEPKYSMGTEENTQLQDPHQLGSVNETTRKFEKIPSKTKGVIPGKPYPKKTETPKKPEPSKFTLNPETAMKQFLNAKLDKADQLRKDEEKKATELQTTQTPETKPEPEVKRVGTATLVVPEQTPEEVLASINDTVLNIACSLTDEERINVITRKVEPGKLGKFNVYATQISSIRKAVEYTYILDGKFIKSMNQRICHRQSNFRFVTSFQKVACILYFTPSELGITDAAFNELAKQVIKENHLQFEDGRAWRGIKNYDRLKKVYASCVKKR